ncbi:hypothetical protein AYI69_g4941 [Smittium culicis]|uniref:Uncharacterized protein n=1 Tax=Smittium culicis TaxID=133412 RepID=A0A1R1YA56_9FUNG|nr:hypothetical protein AYI69_g4941 [Smittium culicis]
MLANKSSLLRRNGQKNDYPSFAFDLDSILLNSRQKSKDTVIPDSNHNSNLARTSSKASTHSRRIKKKGSKLNKIAIIGSIRRRFVPRTKNAACLVKKSPSKEKESERRTDNGIISESFEIPGLEHKMSKRAQNSGENVLFESRNNKFSSNRLINNTNKFKNSSPGSYSLGN